MPGTSSSLLFLFFAVCPWGAGSFGCCCPVTFLLVALFAGTAASFGCCPPVTFSLVRFCCCRFFLPISSPPHQGGIKLACDWPKFRSNHLGHLKSWAGTWWTEKETRRMSERRGGMPWRRRARRGQRCWTSLAPKNHARRTNCRAQDPK